MIQISINCNKAFIWSPHDATVLRNSYRIVGKCVGCSVAAPYQYATLNLPIQIPEAAAKLLEQKGIAHLINSTSVCDSGLKPTESEFLKMREKSFDDQVLKIQTERKEFLDKKANTIVNSKIKKKNLPDDETTRQALVKELYDENKPIPESAYLIQLFTESPWKCENLSKSNWNYPNTEEEKTQFEVYRHFWEKGYFITPGEKFGGDYLVYEGDPEVTHSKYIVVCKPHNEKISMIEMILKGRLATSVKKQVLLCSVNDDKLSCIILNWTHWT